MRKSILISSATASIGVRRSRLRACVVSPIGSGFICGIELVERHAICHAAPLYDGPGRTEVPTSTDMLENYMAMLTSKDKKKMLMGPAAVSSSFLGAKLRRTDITARVAHAYLGQRVALRKCFLDGAAAHGEDAHKRGVPICARSPTKVQLKETIKRKNDANADLATALKKTKCALSHALSRAKIVRDNLRQNVRRTQEKATSRAASASLEARNVAAALIKRQMEAILVLRRFKASRAGNSNPASLALKEREHVGLRCDVKDANAEVERLTAENSRLAAERVELDIQYVEAKKFADSVWLPTRRTGAGAGRGCAHEEEVRRLYMKLLLLRVPPSVLNEVCARNARV